ncbi:hypothetical protein, partial [Saccharopolyspora cebuensis]|uniref:hypothetical protein n=1 Tax=Saccharopolyspora cebuensis TaxID=418759 RepID=UPI0031E87A57
ISLLGTLWNKSGLGEIAAADADPRGLQHISSHPAHTDVTDTLADCGFPFAQVDGAGRFAALCPRCAEHHADQPWIQRIHRT